MNQAILIGRLGKDPELRFTQNSRAVCSFSMATSKRFKKGDDWQEQTQWHNIVAWGKVGEIAAENLVKGSECLVVGEITYRSYEDKSGNKRYVTEINAIQVRAIGAKTQGPAPESTGGGGSTGSIDNDDIPFISWEDVRREFCV